MSEAPTFETNRAEGARPFFSICIPQHNRTDFLILACATFARQTFRDFEICISDDCSNDGKEPELLAWLRASGLTYVYARTDSNLRYDGNLRSAIALSAGRYLFLMGNDDGFSHENVLQAVHDELVRHQPVAVAICNYRDIPSGQVYRRMTTTGLLGAGAPVAASTFRRYSFVGGIVFDGDGARRETTDSVDGSEMYQMYLGARLVGAGGALLSLDSLYVDKDLQIPGQQVDSYRIKPKLDPCPIVERPLPMGRLLEVVAAGLEPSHTGRERERNLLRVAAQLYLFIYPFWVIEYRRIQSRRYALGVYLAVRPGRIGEGLGFSPLAWLRMRAMYVAVGAVALVFPIGLFDTLRPRLYALAKRLRSA